MLKKFPLFYIALLYSFSAKDKIVFFMNQFSIFCSILTIALLICIFSIMNGFEKKISSKFTNDYGHLYIQHKAEEGSNFFEKAKSFNEGLGT